MSMIPSSPAAVTAAVRCLAREGQRLDAEREAATPSVTILAQTHAGADRGAVLFISHAGYAEGYLRILVPMG